MKGLCRFCQHHRSFHYLVKQIRPDGRPGGPKTSTGCRRCICRKYEP